MIEKVEALKADISKPITGVRSHAYSLFGMFFDSQAHVQQISLEHELAEARENALIAQLTPFSGIHEEFMKRVEELDMGPEDEQPFSGLVSDMTRYRYLPDGTVGREVAGRQEPVTLAPVMAEVVRQMMIRSMQVWGERLAS